MANEALRKAMLVAGLSVLDLAAATGVDPKTVERWITASRVPHPGTRSMVCAKLGNTEDVLWPPLRTRVKTGRDREIVAVYPRRSQLPRTVWAELIGACTEQIWCAGYTSYFLWTEVPAFDLVLQGKLAAGVDVRFLLGDPDSPLTAQRDREEASPLTLGARIGVTVTALAPLGAQVRFTDRHLGMSVWIFDNDMIVCTHVANLLGHESPTFHLRRRDDDGLFDRYLGHVLYLWTQAGRSG